MAELTYPGVYIQERPGAPAPIRGVSASTLALVGWTTKGPVGDPILVTGFKEFERIFGGFTADSLLPTTLHAFFANGGNLARIARVAPADADAAFAFIYDPVEDEVIGTGDDTEVTFNATLDGSPVVPGTVVVSDGVEAFSDGGLGVLTGSAGGTGTIDYNTGEISVTFNAAPATAADIEASYALVLWQLDVQWPGDAGNEFEVVLLGAAGQEDDDNASFNLWAIQVLEDGEVVEQFTNLDFSDPDAPNFFPAVVNDEKAGSKFITVTDVGNSGVPSSLSGVQVTGEVVTPTPAIDGSETAFTFTLDAGSCYPGSLELVFTSGGSPLVVNDDGFGNLVGDVSGSVVSTIDYDTGEVEVTFSAAPDNATDIVADYFSKPANGFVEFGFGGGSDGSALTSSDLIGANLVAPEMGLYALNKVDDLLMVVTPDFAGDDVVDQAVLDYCQARMDRFAILTTPEGTSFQDAVTHKRRTLNRNQNSYGAIYWPWVKVLDPVTGKSLTVPPIGHIAGIYARTDANRNVGKAPAGASDGALSFILGLEQSPTEAQVGVLNSNNVNAIVNWPQVGSIAVWGARTLQSVGEFQYIQARRLFMFLQKSIYNATHIYVFEPNGSALWARIRLQLTGFLGNLFQQGYFAGDTPEDAFLIVVDETNNPQESIDAGELYIDIGIAPNRPAEFVVFRFQQKIPG